MTNHEDEIDLRPYLILLIRNWWLILIFGVVLGAAGLIFGLMQPHVYKSTATIIMTRSRTTLSLAEQFPTVPESIDSKSKLQAYLAIAESDAIIGSTFTALKDRLPADYTLEVLEDNVEITTNGDAIAISAIAKDPGLAADIANTWANEATRAINLAYGRGRSSVELDTQLSHAEEEYRKAQTKLEAFIEESPIDLLDQQILEARTLLESLTKQRTWQVDYYNERIRLMEQVIVEAEALKEQLASSSRSSAGEIGDALAVLIARAETFGIRLNPSVTPHMNPQNTVSGIQNTSGTTTAMDPRFNLFLDDLGASGNSAQDYVSDIDSLMTRAQAQKTLAEEAIARISDEIVTGQDSEGIERAAERIRLLETQRERELSLKKELISERDLAWEAYTALQQKQTEIQTSSDVSSEVSLASPAISPQVPESRHIIRNTLIAAVLGGVLGIILVLGLDWWRKVGISQPVAKTPLAEPASSDH